MTKRLSWTVLAAVFLAVGCGEDTEPRYQKVLEKKVLMVGGGEAQVVRVGQGLNVVEMEIPPDVLPQKVEVSITLVSGVRKVGTPPANDAGVLVEPEGVQFAAPVKVRQRIAPPPLMKTYAAVVQESADAPFVVKTAARLVTNPSAELAGDGSGEVWEADGTGTGLWGLALVPAGL